MVYFCLQYWKCTVQNQNIHCWLFTLQINPVSYAQWWTKMKMEHKIMKINFSYSIIKEMCWRNHWKSSTGQQDSTKHGLKTTVLDWHWYPPTLLSHGFQTLFPGVRVGPVMKLTTHFKLFPGLRICGVVPPSAFFFFWRGAELNPGTVIFFILCLQQYVCRWLPITSAYTRPADYWTTCPCPRTGTWLGGLL